MTGQTEQLVEPEDVPNVPDGHEIHAPLETYLPKGHTTQDDDPSAAVEPIGHERQLLELVLLLVGLYVFNGHLKQLVEPNDGPNVPDGQTTQV